MPKEIYCEKCKIYLGEINKCKLRKDIKYLCNDCFSILNTKAASADLADSIKRRNNSNTDFESIFGSLFNNKK